MLYDDLIYRLEKRAEIRRSIVTRKPQERDRIADLLDEAAQALRSRSSMTEQGTVDAQDAGLVPAVTATYFPPDPTRKDGGDFTKWIKEGGAYVRFERGNQLDR